MKPVQQAAARTLVVIALSCSLTAWAGEVIDVSGKYEKLARDFMLENAEQELSGAQSELDRYYALSDAAYRNAAYGDKSKAKAYADELLRLAEKHKGWNYGNAIHYAHLAYGLIAYRSDDYKQARAELIKAGQTPGSPQLNSFGPDMLLASALLRQNDQEAVIRYLDLCAAFWKEGMEPRWELSYWKKQIKDGDTPVFGSRLLN